MTEMAEGSVTHQRLIALLSQEGANFRVVTHEAVGKCEAVSEIRGTARYLRDERKRYVT